MKVSVIIPTYNEEKVIKECLLSLSVQSHTDLEIIVVDDGSTDKTLEVLSEFSSHNLEFRVLKQKHLGPGVARNLGSKNAIGEILVFVDADMTLDKDFIKNLVMPIEKGEVIGTFSKEELVSNKDNIWSKCWNINKGLPIDRMHPDNYSNQQPVFRAILKKEFQKVGGFTPIGYIDDYTVSEKLKVMARVAPGAVFYHRNPETLSEIFGQARWIGKSEFKRRKIKNELFMKIIAVIRYSLPFSLINGLSGALKNALPQYLIFKMIYDFAVEVSLIKSFFGEQVNK